MIAFVAIAWIPSIVALVLRRRLADAITSGRSGVSIQPAAVVVMALAWMVLTACGAVWVAAGQPEVVDPTSAVRASLLFTH
jgi:hypothetical protein